MDYGGAGANQRVRLVANGEWETYDAGESEGTSAGDFIVSWGSQVRHPRCAELLL